MWFAIALKDIETGKATVPKGTLLRITAYFPDQVNLEAVGLTDFIGEPVRVLHNRPDNWLGDIGLSANTFS